MKYSHYYYIIKIQDVFKENTSLSSTQSRKGSSFMILKISANNKIFELRISLINLDVLNFQLPRLFTISKRFKNFSIQIVNYSTDIKTRSEAIENADKIVYVCGTKDEIENLQNPFIIGQNKFHDEYNKLHCFPQYETKTIYITFNQQVQPISLEEANSEKSSLINSSSSSESKQTSIEPSPKFSNFTNSQSIVKSVSYQEALSHKYLKLPEQNKLLISFLLGPDKNCLFSYSRSKNENFSRMHKMARDVCIKRFDKKSRCLIKNDRSNVLYFERNNHFDDDMSAGYLEINDPEFESLIPMCSITSSQSISDDSSKTTYDANELTNEVERMEH
ncbi:hypothetical protein BpHYR1_024614 [Brachionus plicatilis]|uniref:Uncharacterized protein n=1 Tax=Brachionus plicatilis TaxID=10195 RepID=A0A3M7SR72_BRAPC|nr:hypothetical protein BpHYR1_024614 [Brachionus plicatilis]